MRKAIFIFCMIAILAGDGQSCPPSTASIGTPPKTASYTPADTALSPCVKPSPSAVEELPQATDTALQTATHHAVEAPKAAVGIVPQEDKSVSPTQPCARDKTPNSPPKATVPRMGDTRVENGEPQIWIEGFGWIPDNGGGAIGTMVGSPDDELTGNKVGIMGGGTVAEDMYENGNKIGIMGNDNTADSDGDINKMVGIMGGDDEGYAEPPPEEPYTPQPGDVMMDLQTGEITIIE